MGKGHQQSGSTAVDTGVGAGLGASLEQGPECEDVSNEMMTSVMLEEGGQCQPPLDELRDAVADGDPDAAMQAYCRLDPSGMQGLGADTGLLTDLVVLVGPDQGTGILAACAPSRDVHLGIAGQLWGDDDVLTRVLHNVGIQDSRSFYTDGGVLVGHPAFLRESILGPLLDDGDLAGQAMVLADDASLSLVMSVLGGRPVFEVLPAACAESAPVEHAFDASLVAQGWIATDFDRLTMAIASWGTQNTWIDLFYLTGRLEILAARLLDHPSVWADTPADRLPGGGGDDATIFAPGSPVGRVAIDIVARQHPDRLAEAVEALQWPLSETLTVGLADGWLDDMLLAELVDGPTATPESQEQVLLDPVFHQAVVAVGGSVFLLLPQLIADGARFGGVFGADADVAALVSADPAFIPYLVSATGKEVWVQAMLDQNMLDPLMLAAIAAPADWQAATDAGPGFDAVLAATTQPLADETTYDGMFALFGDGTGRSVAQCKAFFIALGGARVLPAGERNPSLAWGGPSLTDSATGNTWTLRKQLLPVDGNRDAYVTMLATLRGMPRVAVQATRSLIFVHQYEWEWQQTGGSATSSGWHRFSTPQLRNLGTSYAWQGMVILYVNGSGAPSTSTVGSDSEGAGTATGGGQDRSRSGGSDQRTTVTPLTYFQNHSYHEFGHSVGAQQFQGMTRSGDDEATRYGNWSTEGSGAFQTAMWSGSDADNLMATPTGSATPQPFPVPAADARDWCTSLLQTGREPSSATNKVNQLPNLTTRQKFQAIQASGKFGSEEMVKYLAAVYTGNASDIPNSAYQFTGYTPSGSSVHIFASREGNSFATYDKAVYTKVKSTTGWYALASHAEMFAEIYTKHYSGSGRPAAHNGVDWTTFFTDLEASPGAAAWGPGAAPAPTSPTTSAPGTGEVEPPPSVMGSL